MVNVWPTEFPGALLGTVSETRSNAFIEDTNEVGANKRRARYSKSLRTFNFRLLLTSALLDILEEFYETTLERGVDKFEWTHYRTGDTVNVQFAGYPSISDHPSAVDRYIAEVSLLEV